MFIKSHISHGLDYHGDVTKKSRLAPYFADPAC